MCPSPPNIDTGTKFQESKEPIQRQPSDISRRKTGRRSTVLAGGGSTSSESTTTSAKKVALGT